MPNNPPADPLARFEWEVASGGYRWINTEWGPALTPRLTQPGPARPYQPFNKRDAGLFLVFAELRKTDAMLAFANQYGLLGAPLSRRRKSGPFEIIELPKVYRSQRPHLDKQHSWTKQILLMRRFLACARLVHKPEDTVWTELKPQINHALRDSCAPVLDWNPDVADEFRFRLDWMPQSLLGALWLQAVGSVTRASRFQQCVSCGRIMEISVEKITGARADARLCSVACRSREYRKRKRHAKQLSRNGWTPARIAKRVGSETQTVRGWLRTK